MKRLLALFSLCLPLYLFAQGFGSFSHDQPFFASSGTSTPVWTPTNLVNIAGWWIADEFYTNASPSYPVLPDRSGHGYDLTNRAAAGAWPTWETNAVNGHYSVKWDGVADHLSAWDFVTSTNTELWMVMKYNGVINTTSLYIMCSTNNAPPPPNVNITTGSTGKLSARASSTASVITTSDVFKTNTWMIFTMKWTPTDGSFLTNNVLASNQADMNCGNYGLVFGARGGLASGFTKIEVAEAVILGTAQTTGARSNLFHYMTNKYAISP